MRGPTLKVYLGFGSTWTTADASITWTEVTSKVLMDRGCQISRGRGTELEDYRTGTCSFTLDNRERLFDPSYTGSRTPFTFTAAQLLPGLPVKVEAVANSTTLPVFRGFITGLPQVYPEQSDSIAFVPISAVDGTAKLANAGTPSSVYAIEVAADSPMIWWRLGETIGPAIADSSGNRYDAALPTGQPINSTNHPNPWETSRAFDANGDMRVRTADSAARIADDPYTLEGIVTVGDLTDTTQRDVLRQSDADAGIFWSVGVLGFGGTNYRWLIRSHMAGEVTDSQWNTANIDISTLSAEPFFHVVVRRNGATHTLYLNGEAQTLTSIGGDTNTSKTYEVTGAGGTSGWIGKAADLAVYDTDIGTTRLAAHYAALTAPWEGDTTGARIARILDLVGWPADLRDIATGLTNLGPATLGSKAGALVKGFERAEQGRLFIARDGSLTFFDRYHYLTVTEGSAVQATFSDDGSDIPYRGFAYAYDTRFVFNRIRGSRVGGGEIEVFDQTSIDTHGEQVDSSLQGIQVRTDAEVLALCELRLNRYKDPQLRAEPIHVALHGITEAQQATVLGLELGYRVNVERTPNDTGSAIDEDTLVEGISHSIGPGRWDTTITTSPVDPTEYMIWGTGLWGTGKWAA